MISFITQEDYKVLSQSDPEYYKRRWTYFQDIIYMLSKTKIQFKSSIELGSYKFSIAKGNMSDTMDYVNHNNATYVFDANITPWNISDKKYDLFIGLQVLEHLTNQKQIFSEIKRISNYAIISLPYMWNCVGDCHHGINEDTIFSWTNTIPEYCLISGGDTHNKNKRIACFYKF